MKWFKHISDSLDDPFIFSLMEEFGSDGYVVFFGTIEIYSREFLPKKSWKLDVSLTYFHRKFLISPKKIKKILSKIYKWDISYDGNQVSIFIPRFTEIMDEWTSRKIGSCSGVSPEILTHDKEEDKEEDKELKASLNPNPLLITSIEEPTPETAFLKKTEEKKPVAEEVPFSDFNPTPKPDKKNLLSGLQKIVEECAGYFNAFDQRQVILFVEGHLRDNHPDAIKHCLESVITQCRNGVKIKKPKAYLEAALKIEDGKFNAADSERRSNEFKKLPVGVCSIGSILGRIHENNHPHGGNDFEAP